MGGEHKGLLEPIAVIAGSSPRGRGTLLSVLPRSSRLRFIPAWAGNTATSSIFPNPSSVHPRVGGEHVRLPLLPILVSGSSPRGRGTHLLHLSYLVLRRFIPAWAGNTMPPHFPRRYASVHPRVGGEHHFAKEMTALLFGSSPRGRGTLIRRVPVRTQQRFIPAWAGNTQYKRSTDYLHAVHPRVGGEHEGGESVDLQDDGSSPRGRGTHWISVVLWIVLWFIPAWAGNTIPTK